MFAIVRTGGKQYRVAAGDKIVVEKLAGEAGDSVTLSDVLFAGDGGESKSTDGLTVSAEIVAQAKADKVTVFKKRRRHNYRRKKGHRQQLTILKITAIGDKKHVPSKAEGAEKKAAPKAEAAAKAEAAPAEKPAKAAAKPKPEAPAKGAVEAPAKGPKPAAPKKDAAGKAAPKPAPSEVEGGDAAPAKKASTKKPASGKAE
jgi:large subunit ribosomal protein L21